MNSKFLLVVLYLIPIFSLGQKKVTTPIPTSAGQRIASYEKRTASEVNSIVSNIAFRNVGPTVMSGRVVDIAVNPIDPTKFFVAYASGGVWYTSNNGTTFSSIFDNQLLIDIGALAVNWKNQEQPEIWIGTGECNSSRSSYAGTGIYHSTDGGKTWNNKGLTETHHIGKIIISATDNKTVFVAAIGHLYTSNKERGIFKSSDGGETWKQTLFIDENTGAIDLFVDPTNATTLYAIGWHRERKAWNFVESGQTSGIYKSTNNGENWNLITDLKSGFPNGEGVGRIGLAIFPGNTNIIYAIVDNQSIVKDTTTQKKELSSNDFRTMDRDQFLAIENNKLKTFLTQHNFPEKYSVEVVRELVDAKKIEPIALADFISDANSDLFNKPIIGAEIYRSDDAGLSWKKININPIKDLFYTYGYYFGKIWVSPFDENEVYIAGVELLKSTNGGKVFQSTNGVNQHGDHHALWIDPVRKGHLINGNDGGINISWDNGTSWFKANTPAVGQFYAVNVDQAIPYNVYGGLQDNGVWFGPSNYTPSLAWYDDGEYPYKRILGGDGMQVQIDTRDNNTIYTGYQFGNYFRIDKSKHTEKEIRPTMELGDKPLRFNWQAPIWLSIHNQDILYFGAQRLYRSLDQGNKFTAISTDLTQGGRIGDVPYGTISAICESPIKFGLLYTGSDDGLIHVTKDGGVTWKKIAAQLPQNLRVNRIIASAFVEGRVYAVLSGFQWDNFSPYLYSSENYGETWVQIGLDLPMEPLNVIREDPENPNLLFVGTDQGLYTTVNRGQSFMRMTNNLPPVAVHDLVIQKIAHDLVVGTHGRSIYIAPIEALEKLSDSIQKKELYLYKIENVKLQPNYVSIDGIYKEVLEPQINITWFSKSAGPTLIRITSVDKKNEFVVLKDTSELGLNFLNSNFPIDSANVEAYTKYLKNIYPDAKPQVYSKGRCLLAEGEYLLEIEIAGTKQSLEFKIVQDKSEIDNHRIPTTPTDKESIEFFIDK